MLSEIVNPATLPPVKSPLCFTLKKLEDIKYSSVFADDEITQFVEYFNEDDAIVAPAIIPPVNNTCDPVIFPVADICNLEEDINKFCLPSVVGIPEAEPLINQLFELLLLIY